MTVQLIRADNGYHLWSKTYDRDFEDIFKVQDEIAAAVVDVLKAKLAPERPWPPIAAQTPRPTTSTCSANGFTVEETSTASGGRPTPSTKRSLLDPDYAAGSARLALSEYVLGRFDGR